MGGTRRLALCAVPTNEVLDLTAELASLGGGDVAVGRTWVGATVVEGNSPSPLAWDACRPDGPSLCSAMHGELWPWLRDGYSASVVLLSAQRDKSSSGISSSSGGGGSAMQLSATDLLARLSSAALADGLQLGISWEIVRGDAVLGPLGRHKPPDTASPAAKRTEQAQPRRPSSRLGREAAPDLCQEPQQCCVQVHSSDELAQLLAVARQQVQQLEAADGAQPPALLLRVTLRGSSRQPGAGVHVLHVHADCAGTGSSPGKTQQAAVATDARQQEALLSLLGEVADLHQRRREGDHLLTTAKLSPLNQLAAPLLAGGARLFVAASLHSGSGSAASGARQQQSGGPLGPLLSSLKSVQAVCSRGVATPGDQGAAAMAWLPCDAFLQQIRQQEQAEQQRRAAAAAQAAAEASRREQLRAAARERQQGQQKGATRAAASQRTCDEQETAQQAQQAQQAQGPGELPAESELAQGPSRPGSPAAAARLQQPARQQAAGQEGAQAAEPCQVQQVGTGCTAGQESPAPADRLQCVVSPGSDAGSATSSSLQHLRQQFQSLYAAVAAPQQHAKDAARLHTKAAGSPVPPAGIRQPAYRTIAAGVAAADDIATHIVVLRTQAAAEAQRALQAERQLVGGSPVTGAAGLSAAAGGAADAGFTWTPGHSASVGSRPSSASLADKLEQELLQLQQQAAARAEAAAAAAAAADGGTPVWGTADLADADMASFADLEPEAPSLAAMFRSPAGRTATTGSVQLAASWAGSPAGAQQAQQQQQQLAQQQQHAQQVQQQHASDSPSAKWGNSRHCAPPPGSPGWPSVSQRPGRGYTEVSDVFQSDGMPLFTPPPAAAGADKAGPVSMAGAAAWADDGGVQHACDGSGSDGSYLGSVIRQRDRTSAQRQPAAADQEPEASDPSHCASSYAAASRLRCAHRSPPSDATPGPARHAADLQAPAASNAQGSSYAAPSTPPPSQQSWGEDEVGAAAAVDSGEPGAADVAALLAELQQEQRVNAALLQQLHEVQQALEGAVAAAAAAAQPLAPGVEDPADFNGLLAALQRERQQHAASQRQLALQRQHGEERELALEARLHTLQRQLAVMAARCRAWEARSPLAQLFQQCEEELGREQARGGRLEAENRQLAAMLADADVERLAGTAAQLGDEPAAALLREHQRKLQAAQAQLRALHEQKAELQKEVQAARRRDRLAELCRRQAESGNKAVADARRQLAARERQLEAQSLAAAEAAAEAARLRERLRRAELELGQVLADKADLADTVSSLRHQVGMLRGQASRHSVLKSIQGPPQAHQHMSAPPPPGWPR